MDVDQLLVNSAFVINVSQFECLPNGSIFTHLTMKKFTRHFLQRYKKGNGSNLLSLQQSVRRIKLVEIDRDRPLRSFTFQKSFGWNVLEFEYVSFLFTFTIFIWIGCFFKIKFTKPQTWNITRNNNNKNALSDQREAQLLSPIYPFPVVFLLISRNIAGI